jgi:nitrite reductase/ring-hydroxylating ferredoxin subunit
MAQEYKLKDISSLADIKNMDKVESEVEGVEGGKVLVLRFNGQVHAMSPKCTHYGAPLKLGVVAPDGRITCPWHGGMLVLVMGLDCVPADLVGSLFQYWQR